MTKDEAQRNIRTFYEAVNFKERKTNMLTRPHLLLASLLIFVLSVLGPRPGQTETVSSPPSAKADYLVLVSIDACRPDYFPLADIPHIKTLMKEGVSYDRAWVGQLRNNTPPGHTTMATGSFPKNDGILCFGWRDPSNKTGSLPTSWKNVTSGYMNDLIAQSGATSMSTLYKKVHPEAKVAAISSEKTVSYRFLWRRKFKVTKQ